MASIAGVILALEAEHEGCGEREDQRGRGESAKPTAAV
jgi:hypothetical protein